MYGNLICSQYYLVEVTLATLGVGQKTYFPDIPQLRNVYVQGVEVYTATQISRTPNNFVPISAANVIGTVTSFVVEETESVFLMPNYTLISSINAGILRLFNNLQINWVKSYVQEVAAGTITANDTVCFGIYFTRRPQGAKKLPPSKR